MNVHAKRKTTWQKGLAVLMAIIVAATMCITTANPVFAATTTEKNTQSENQINYTGGQTSDANVKISKTIEPTGIENYFDITLTATTPKTIEEVVEPVDVVIVLDKSQSMSNKNKLTIAQTAACKFIDDYLNADNLGANRKIGVVAFDTDADIIHSLSTLNSDSVAETIKNKINAITTESNVSHERFTNIEGGLKQAQTLITNSSSPHKFIILLTDGFPTTYIDTSRAQTEANVLQGWDPYCTEGTPGKDGVFYDAVAGIYCELGTSYSDKGAIKAQNLANQIKQQNINIFSVGIDIASQKIEDYLPEKDSSFSVLDRTSTDYAIKGDYDNWLKNVIAGGPDIGQSNRYCNGDDLANLNLAYSSILSEIKTINTKAAENSWVAADPMGSNAEFIHFYDKSGVVDTDNKLSGTNTENAENTATYSDRINWNLLKSGYTKKVVNNTTEYTYSLKYRVRLTNEASAFEAGTVYNTNGTTTFNYSLNENGVITPQDGLDFKIPSVKGYLGELTFTKKGINEHVDEDVAVDLSGAEFKLTHKSNCSICKAANNSVAINTMKATSEENGRVTFTGIPSGHEYTLVEVSAPADYIKDTVEYSVTVGYGVTTSNITSNTINNKRKAPVELTIAGAKTIDDKKPAGESFKFALTDKDGNVIETVKSDDQNGSFAFAALKYQETGEFEYLIKEVVPKDATKVADDGRFYDDKFVYDDEVYSVKVTVTNGHANSYVLNVVVKDSNGNSVYENEQQIGKVTINNNNVLFDNDALYALPETGGMGTTMMYLAGLILVAGAAFVLIRRRRSC